ncbi:hypothetical protein J437_LFUL008516, partial [Ladona fulva]
RRRPTQPVTTARAASPAKKHPSLLPPKTLPVAMDFLNKKFKMVSSENFDEYMKALGVGLVTRKMGNAVTPTVEVTEKDGVFTIKTTSTFKNSEINFKLGEEFDEETVDGRKVKSVVTKDGNKLIHLQKGEKETTIIREFSGDEMKAILKVDDIVCTRVYKSE